jgi:hypothetical protein
MRGLDVGFAVDPSDFSMPAWLIASCWALLFRLSLEKGRVERWRLDAAVHMSRLVGI